MITVGVGGPVGAGKTAVIQCLCLELREEYSIGILANDIRGSIDADYLKSHAVLSRDFIVPVQTGLELDGFLNFSSNLNRRELKRIIERHSNLDLVFVEGVGDRLDARFHADLVNLFIYVIDYSAGDRLPLKGGPGIEESQLLVVNKIDLYSETGENRSLGNMMVNLQSTRRGLPTLLVSTHTGFGVDILTSFIREKLLLARILSDDKR